jgi:hypothetical protein
MKKYLVILLSASSTIAQSLADFPLWGTTWLIAKGQNHCIYPTFSKACIPTHVVSIVFPQYPQNQYIASKVGFSVSWANLNHKYYRCTAEVIDDIKKQFEANKSYLPFEKFIASVNNPDKDSAIAFKRRIVNDTVWSCEKSLQRAERKGYTKFHVIFNGQEIVYHSGAIPTDNPKWQRKYPLAWGDISTSMRMGMYPIVDSSTMHKVKGYEVSEDGWLDYCDVNLCHERIICTDYKLVPATIWQVHLIPDVRWFPRDFQSGEPLLIDKLRMDFKTALLKRQQSLANMDNVDLKYYRNPYFSDSASTVISFNFIDDTIRGAKPLSQRDYVSTVNMPEQTDDTLAPSLPMYFDNIPNKIVRVKQEYYGLEKAILRLYTDTQDDVKYSDSLFDRCVGWQITDKMLADYRYPPRLQKTGTKPRKDSTYVEDIHWYHGCPCLPISHLADFTKQQLRMFIYNVPPFCSYEAMSNAMYILQQAFVYCDNYKDRAQIVRHILNLHGSLLKKEEFFSKNNLTAQQRSNFDSRCNESWENLFPRYVTSYTSDLRSRAERVLKAVQTFKSVENNIYYIASMW